MALLIDMIVEEMKAPFKDPRVYRSQIDIPFHDLLYMLIEETEQTFKRGIIVTAQVIRVIERMDINSSFVLCKLDNGLDAKVDKTKLDLGDRNIENVLKPGDVITGRIDTIKDNDENYSVQLTCRRVDLENHGNFVSKGIVYEPEDLINPAFKVDRDGGA